MWFSLWTWFNLNKKEEYNGCPEGTQRQAGRSKKDILRPTHCHVAIEEKILIGTTRLRNYVVEKLGRNRREQCVQ